jgi:hypothetical protein
MLDLRKVRTRVCGRPLADHLDIPVARGQQVGVGMLEAGRTVRQPQHVLCEAVPHCLERLHAASSNL